MRAMAPIFLCREGFRIDRVAGASLTRDEQEDAKDRAILRAVRGGAQTKNAIGKVVRGNRKACLDRVDDLEERGHIAIGSASGSGKYVVTTSGARLLELSE